VVQIGQSALDRSWPLLVKDVVTYYDAAFCEGSFRGAHVVLHQTGEVSAIHGEQADALASGHVDYVIPTQSRRVSGSHRHLDTRRVLSKVVEEELFVARTGTIYISALIFK